MEKNTLVILAAGKGTRFLPLTNTLPKPLLKVAGKPILEHQIEAALPFISDIVIVVGYLKEKIQQNFGDNYKGVPITYVHQLEPLGTGDALRYVSDKVSGDSFILIYGDDIYDTSLFEKISQKSNVAVGMNVKNWQSFGIFKLKPDNSLESIIEKPTEHVGNLANIGMYKLNRSVFTYVDKISKSSRNELELTDIITLLAQDNRVEIVQAEKGWTPLSFPWHLLEATQQLLENISSTSKGVIEEGATLKAKVVVGEGTIIKSGAYIEGNFVIGKNCIIGPNCYLKEFGVIGDNCVIGNAVEITRSIIGDNTNIRHLSYFGDSILGNNVNVGTGTMVANLKHPVPGDKEKSNVNMMINGTLVNSGRQKLGTIIGDNAKLGIQTSIYPGRKIWNDQQTLPTEVIDRDKNTT